MKRQKFIFLFVFLFSLFAYKNVYAFDVSNYRYRDLCGNFEVASFLGDGSITNPKCFSTYEEAKGYMDEAGGIDLAMMTRVNGEVKIVDANAALVDLTVNPEALTFFYENSDLTSRQYTYMDNGSLYGGVDGGFLETGYSSTYYVWSARVRVANFTGWISQGNYEIVPINWVKSYSSYTVTNDFIRHNYISKVQNDYRSSGGSTIGPKPSMLNPGTYYSYDGHYFYDDIKKLAVDYRNNTYKNAVNANNPYYNYYMYLSNHTRTNYSSVNIDEFIRNNLGYKKDAYGVSASDGTSRLYGSGNYFYYAQEKYGVNAVLALSLSRNETGNGKSYLAVNKNNGFGLNAVDSNPIGGANWYASFATSILGYASKWYTYGYGHPSDWRYFGPQFGDKWIGMNVKYASDPYWSEKMAGKYYELDKALGLQDYDYYQLGVLKNQARAYSGPTTSSRAIYTYPEAEDGVVIIGEVTSGSEKWYKVVSDLNIDSNFNEITSGNYNWNSYVYVRASDIRKINTGKNGYVSPNDVTEYQNKNYEYDFYVENTELKPKVAISVKNSDYYYDASLTSRQGSTLLKDRYVMVYAVATLNHVPVSYLVTSDYFYDQKHWVSADSIKFSSTAYGRVSVNADGNQYTWVNYNTEDKESTKIGGLYTYAFVPILESVKVGNDLWYKVPVSLTSNNNVYGYTLSQYGSTVSIKVSDFVAVNNKPVINASNQVIVVGRTFDPMAGVSANDVEDGDLTSSIQITKNTVDTGKAGNYVVVYSVKDSSNNIVEKQINVEVIATPIEADGEFYLEALDFNENSKKYSISGYLTILRQNNVDKSYYLILSNKSTGSTYRFQVSAWRDATPYSLGSVNGKSYVDSWFKGEVDLSSIDNGDYDLYMSAYSGNYYTTQLIDNFANQDIDRRAEDEKHGYSFKVLSNLKSQAIELQVRDKLYTLSEAPTYRNMINDYEEIKFVDNKLSILGYSYNYGGTYSDSKSITRKLILENTVTYEAFEFDLGSANGPYKLTSKDNLDKTYAWYQKEIDISNLEKGTYSLIVYTKTSNAEDYGEVRDMFDILNETSVIDDKNYTITYNRLRQDRLELTVK